MEQIEVVAYGRASIVVRAVGGARIELDQRMRNAGVQSIVPLGRDCDGCSLFDLVLEWGTNAKQAANKIRG